MQAYTRFQETALFVLRLSIAAILLFAGYAKLSFWSAAPEGMSRGMANLLKFLSIVEPLGGVALVVGFLTRWAAAGLAVIMAGAIFFLRLTMQAGFFTTPQGAGLDYNLLRRRASPHSRSRVSKARAFVNHHTSPVRGTPRALEAPRIFPCPEGFESSNGGQLP